MRRPALSSFARLLGPDGLAAVAGVVVAGLLRAVAVVVEATVIARILAAAIEGGSAGVRSFRTGRPTVSLHPLAMASTLVAAGVLFAVSGLLAEVAGDAAARRARARLRRRGLEAAVVLAARGLDPSSDGRGGVGALASELTSGVDGIDPFVGRYLPHAVLAVAVPTGLLAWIASRDLLSAGLAGLALILLPVMAGLVGIGTAPAVRRRLEATERLGDRFVALLRGLPLLVAYDRAEAHEEVVRRAGEEARQATLASLRLALLSAFVLEIGAAVGTALVAVPLGLRLDAGAPILPAALAVLFVTPEVYFPVRTLAADFHAGAGGRQVLGRLEELEARSVAGLSATAPPDGGAAGPTASLLPGGGVFATPGGEGAPDRLSPLPATPVGGRDRSGSEDSGSRGRGVTSAPLLSTPGLMAGGARGVEATLRADDDDRPVLVQLERVSVEYPARDTPALTSASLVLRAGDRVALLGPSGAGKSTVLRVIASLVEPTAGRVVRRWPAEGPLGWIPQRPSVVPGSVFDNVALGRPGVDEATVERALRAVGLARLLEGPGAGLQARLGDDGRRLSLGERRRLAVARVLAGPRPVLWLLDEPTEGLDDETAATVVALLATATKGRTVLLATHDRRALVLTDRVVLLEGGRLDDPGRGEGGTRSETRGTTPRPECVGWSWPSVATTVAMATADVASSSPASPATASSLGNGPVGAKPVRVTQLGGAFDPRARAARGGPSPSGVAWPAGGGPFGAGTPWLRAEPASVSSGGSGLSSLSGPSDGGLVVGSRSGRGRRGKGHGAELAGAAATEPIGPEGRPILRSFASRGGLRAVVLSAIGELAALGLLAAGAWLLLDASLRPPILLLSVAIALVRLFALLRGAARYGDRLASHDLGLRRQAELRAWLFSELARAWPRRVRLGDVLSRLLHDTEEVQDLLVRAAVPLAGAAVALVVAAVVAGGLEPESGVLLGGGSLIVVSGLIVSTHLAGPRRRRLQAAKAEVAAVVAASLVAAEELSVLGARRWVIDTLAQAEAGLGRASRAAARALGATRAVSLAAGTVLVGAVLVVGGRAVFRGELRPVPFGVLTFVTVAAAAVLGTVSDALARVPVGREGLARLRELGASGGADGGTSHLPGRSALGATSPSGRLETDPLEPLSGAPRMRAEGAGRAGSAPVLRLESGAIGVPADAPGAPALLLRDVELELRPGEPVGLIGGSGSGKTTLALTLAGLLPLVGGQLSLDGRDVAAWDLRSWRRLVALSEEEPVVFATSVRANLKVVAPWASDAEIRAVLAAVGLSRWCEGRTGGLDARIGPWGEPVSGGERQRIGLARALLSGRPILLLDEPTAHLGPEEAEVVRRAILAAAETRSVLWITHRPEDLELSASAFQVETGIDGAGRLRPVTFQPAAGPEAPLAGRRRLA